MPEIGLKGNPIPAPVITMILLGGILLATYLGTIPGLHGDEAAYGLRAHSVLEGKEAMVGTSPYTGPIFPTTAAFILWMLGDSVSALRLLTVLASIACIVLYRIAIMRLFDRRLADLSTLLLVSMPFFTTFGRLATEAAALNPLLALSAIVMLLRTTNEVPPRKAVASNAIAGAFLGLGIWNHLIFIAVPVSLLAAEIYRNGTRAFRVTRTYVVALGALAIIAPRLIFGATARIATPLAVAISPSPPSLRMIAKRLIEWPVLLCQLAHGDLLFKRFAGQIAVATPNLAAILLFIGVLAVFWKLGSQGIQARNREVQVMVFGVTLFICTAVLCPTTSDRYFLLLLYLVPLVIAFGLREFFDRGRPRLGLAVLLLFAALQIGRTVINYFVLQHRTGGQISTFRLAGDLETSNHFMRTDRLYQYLADHKAKCVSAEFFIALPLHYYDLDRKVFTSVSVADTMDDLALPENCREIGANFVVMYSGGIRRLVPTDSPAWQTVFSDAKFIVMRAVPHHEAD